VQSDHRDPGAESSGSAQRQAKGRMGPVSASHAGTWRHERRLPFPRLRAEHIDTIDGSPDCPPLGSPDAGGERVQLAKREEDLSIEPAEGPDEATRTPGADGDTRRAMYGHFDFSRCPLFDNHGGVTMTRAFQRRNCQRCFGRWLWMAVAKKSGSGGAARSSLVSPCTRHASLRPRLVLCTDSSQSPRRAVGERPFPGNPNELE
jgi:hypothetical protein